jgi:hypothetical protein
MSETAQSRRKRLTISLRFFLLLVIVIGVALGWMAYKVRRQKRAVAAIQAYGGFVRYDWEVASPNAPGFNGKVPATAHPPGPAWLRRLLGDELFQEVVQVSLVYDESSGKRMNTPRRDDEVMPYLRDFPQLRVLLIQGEQASDRGFASLKDLGDLEEIYAWEASKLTDNGVANLKDLKKLRTLHIGHSRLSDVGLKYLAALPRLERASLQGNHISDEGLRAIQNMTSLKQLHVGLGHGVITDAGLAHLKRMSRLSVLDIQRSRVTAAGLLSLRKLPKLTEIWCSETGVTDEDVRKLPLTWPGLTLRR